MICLLVGLLVGLKTTAWISAKFSKRMRNGPIKNPFNFGVHPTEVCLLTSAATSLPH